MIAFRLLVVCILTGILTGELTPTYAQSQASSGQIEGIVTDQKQSIVSQAVLTARHIETGATRSVTTDDSGVYRFFLLPLGTYRLTVEAPNFKRTVRTGINVAAGPAATVDLQLEPGNIEESVLVSGDTSVADSGKTEIGRVMNSREIQNLPLLVRNPYQLGRIQANVNGRWNRGFGFTLFNANGYARRVNYQIDGNANTLGGSGSVRFSTISETFVSEVQLVSNGFSAEFGNTVGMVMNVITPSGGNKFTGNVAYRFRLPTFYSRPFFFGAKDLPKSRSDGYTAVISGPILKDRAFYYFGFEDVIRQNNSTADRLLTITPENRDRLIALGLSPSIFPVVVPSSDRGPMFIVRSDIQLNQVNRVAIRFNYNDGESPGFPAVRLNTLERITDAFSKDAVLGIQLASYSPRVLNEFRFQYGQRQSSSTVRNATSGNGPSITITGVAGFGSPLAVENVFPTNRVIQFQNNLTRTTGRHAVKLGGGLQFYKGIDRSPQVSTYTFSTIEAYRDARTGVDPFSYDRYEESFGEPGMAYAASFWNLFLQDDWKVTRRLKVNYGLRYDLYLMPKAVADSPLLASQDFKVDKNNIAPRLGVVYTVRDGQRPTILRVSAGIYYDAPLLQLYRRPRENNGSPRFRTVTFIPGTTPGAPAFPGTLSGSLPPGMMLPPTNIDAISPDFETMYAIHTTAQVEQSLTEDLSIAVAYVHSGGRHIPVYRSINCIPTGGTLADGRPLFAVSPSTSCTNRILPQFNIIQMAESVGVSQYDALNLQVTQRFWRGIQFNAHYTLSRAVDDAPEQNLANAPNMQGFLASDPTNRNLDKGYSFADQRHTFIMGLVAQPRFRAGSRSLNYVLNNNQISILANANSGERFNIVAVRDLNRDGVTTSDRPVGIKRNSGTTPTQFNVDLRYSRFVPLSERYRLEVFGEFQNLFNTNSIVAYNNVTVATNDLGQLISPLPNFRTRNQSVSQDSRQFQAGIKFIF